MAKENIILRNNALGIETIFFNEENGILGYTENGVVYLNEAYDSDLSLVNKHEVLHLFEDGEQFLNIKKIIFELFGEEELKRLREEYYFKYVGLYTEEEINNGVLDNEIIIDIIIGNGRFGFMIDEYIVGAYESIVKKKEGISLTEKAKRYLSLNVSRNTRNRYTGLEGWDLIFAERYYEGKQKPVGVNRFGDILIQAKESLGYLERVFGEGYFVVDSANNPYLERKLADKMRICEFKGEYETADKIRGNWQGSLEELAREYSAILREQGEGLRKLLLHSDYEDSFKYLMLNEILTKTYRYEKGNRIIEKRQKGKTILPFMLINDFILREIHDNINKYKNFADLYFDTLDKYKKEFLNSGGVYFRQNDMGCWIRFEKGQEGTDKFNKDVRDLSILIEDTPWCTRKDVGSQLKQGDFYVFVDNFGTPRIAVQLIRERINEVRGIAGGNDQEIENEYRQVAIDFLRDNPAVPGGDLWLKKEERNQMLEECLVKMKTKVLSDEDIEELIKLLNVHEILTHGNINSNEKKILEEIKNDENLRKRIANYSESAEKVLLQIEEMERNARIIKYCEKLEKGTIKESDYQGLLQDILHEFKSINAGLDEWQISEYRKNQERLIGVVNGTDNSFKNYMAVQWECNSEEIYIGRLDLNAKRNRTFMYKIVVGDIILLDSVNIDLSKLQFIKGRMKMARSKSVAISSLIRVDGDVGLFANKDIDLGCLEFVGGNLEVISFEESDLHGIRIIKGDAIFGRDGGMKEYPDLEEVHGNLKIDYRTKKMDKLRVVKGSVTIDRYCLIEELPCLEECKEFLGTVPRKITEGFSYDEGKKVFVRRGNKR